MAAQMIICGRSVVNELRCGFLAARGPFLFTERLLFQLWLFVHEQQCSHLTLAAGHKHCLSAVAMVAEEPGAVATCAGQPHTGHGSGTAARPHGCITLCHGALLGRGSEMPLAGAVSTAEGGLGQECGRI